MRGCALATCGEVERSGEIRVFENGFVKFDALAICETGCGWFCEVGLCAEWRK